MNIMKYFLNFLLSIPRRLVALVLFAVVAVLFTLGAFLGATVNSVAFILGGVLQILFGEHK